MDVMEWLSENGWWTCSKGGSPVEFERLSGELAAFSWSWEALGECLREPVATGREGYIHIIIEWKVFVKEARIISNEIFPLYQTRVSESIVFMLFGYLKCLVVVLMWQNSLHYSEEVYLCRSHHPWRRRSQNERWRGKIWSLIRSPCCGPYSW